MLENHDEFSESDEEISDVLDTTCLICMEDNMNNDSILVASKSCKCSKFYHIECFLEWYQNERKCLICHKKLPKSQINIFIFNIESNEWESITLEAVMRIFNLSRKNKYKTLVNISNHRQQLIEDTSQNNEMIIENNYLSFLRYVCKIICFLLLIIIGLMLIYLFLYRWV